MNEIDAQRLNSSNGGMHRERKVQEEMKKERRQQLLKRAGTSHASRSMGQGDGNEAETHDGKEIIS
ncbi:hypothetical protein BDV38DRAFT_244227 [Aspergillus pseudotamarii]|uniref:IBB domain-containing protein n=1 Tax=Aspergillus pseudotamarii TaxID=132259 RepID=A0A5N6SXM1_ASPPS|nr:uncharacterized protein BDV38DRAFT_244227 [Aspergillus pseudotamarii]KAE8138657.1 hypothetical protein BDV38DRAFT_244227 [Aspergillus pseudotamarii]